jgi:DNA-binding CsgD family transcriptional regulator
MKADPVTKWHIQQIVRLCHAGLDSQTLMVESIKRLRTVMPIDASFFATVDPATLLFTGSVVDDILLPATPQFFVNEFLQHDVNAFRSLARAAHPVGDLDTATQHSLELSPRYRDILAPLALGDELRAVLRADGICWGVLCLHRERSSVPFTPTEADLLYRLTPHLAQGLRRALLMGSGSGIAPSADPPAEIGPTPTVVSVELDEPGLLVLADDLSLMATTPAAERWLSEVAVADWPHTRELPTAVYAVVARLRALEQDIQGLALDALDTLTSRLPRARLRTRSGHWLVLHASRMSSPTFLTSHTPLAPRTLSAPIAVILEVAQPLEIAPLIIQAYDLSKREGEITLLVVRGLSTAEIASDLHISAHTVQDHLKAIFDRVGVRSRRELIAGIFTQQYQPRILAGSSLDSHGQFR